MNEILVQHATEHKTCDPSIVAGFVLLCSFLFTNLLVRSTVSIAEESIITAHWRSAVLRNSSSVRDYSRVHQLIKQTDC